VASAGAAVAATKRLKPLDFVPADAGVNAFRSPAGVGGVGGTASFAAPLVLPVGATLTGIRFHTTGATGSRSATIHGFVVNAAPIIIGSVSTTETVGDVMTPASTTGSLTSTTPLRVISADMLYYVELSCADQTAIWAVDVDYIP
jgi:hypothetical protein